MERRKKTKQKWTDLLRTVRTSAAPHQQLGQADVQELQQEAMRGNPHTAVVGEHPVQGHYEEEQVSSSTLSRPWNTMWRFLPMFL